MIVYSLNDIHLKAMQTLINQKTDVNVNNLHYADESVFEKLKESEMEKIKAYCCVIFSRRRLEPKDVENLEKLVDIKV